MAVRYLDGEVNLLWARPNDGYDVEVIDDGPGRVFVRFRSDRARSRVYAYYVDGQPTQNVDEQGGGRDKGDGDRSSSEFDGDGRHRR